MKKIIKEILKKFLKIIMSPSVFLKLFWFNKGKIFFLVNTPVHCNIGDQAITLAELQYLKRNFPQNRVVEINELEWEFYKKYIKRNISSDSIIFIHGGGYLGTLWRKQSNRMFEIMNAFPDNNKVILPQTAYYDNEEALLEDKEIFAKMKKLWICARDQKTYSILTDELDVLQKNVFLVPDIVTTYRWKNHNYLREKTGLLVFRNDDEKVVDYNLFNLIKKILESKKYTLKQIDMVQKYFIFPLRKQFVNKKLEEFERSSFVVTDRLHGMYFSAITNTPCIILDNLSGKVKGGSKWLEKKASVVVLQDENHLKTMDLEKLINERKTHDYMFYEEQFDEVNTLISDMLHK